MVKLKLILTAGTLFVLSACSYTYPVSQYDQSAYPVTTLGVFVGLNKEIPTADSPRTVGIMSATDGYLAESARLATSAQETSAAFAEVLSQYGYDPVARFYDILETELKRSGVNPRPINGEVERKIHPGLSNNRYSYIGNVDGLDAILDFKFTNWGFSTARDGTVIRPYMFFNVRLLSPDGSEKLMDDVIQFNDINWTGINSTMIMGDQTMTFDSLGELLAHPELATEYMDAAFAKIAADIAHRLRQS